MNQKLLLAALALLLVVVVIQGRSQGTPTEQESSDDEALCPVATLDLTKVFKRHERFADLSEKMRTEVTVAEQELKSQRDAYGLQAKELEQVKKGTAEHERLSAELNKSAETLHAQINRQKEAFLRQEAAIYLESYDQVNAAVQEYAEKRGIKLVLRFTGEPIDRTDPQEVLKELNKSVIYQAGIDITNDILAMLNGRG